MQTTFVSYDKDIGTLFLRMDDGSEYQVTHPGHARLLKDKISVGGLISEEQRFWLEKYRVAMRETNRDGLRKKLRELREELRQ